MGIAIMSVLSTGEMMIDNSDEYNTFQGSNDGGFLDYSQVKGVGSFTFTLFIHWRSVQ